jgi:hypothetical protein
MISSAFFEKEKSMLAMLAEIRIAAGDSHNGNADAKQNKRVVVGRIAVDSAFAPLYNRCYHAVLVQDKSVSS